MYVCLSFSRASTTSAGAFFFSAWTVSRCACGRTLYREHRRSNMIPSLRFIYSGSPSGCVSRYRLASWLGVLPSSSKQGQQRRTCSHAARIAVPSHRPTFNGVVSVQRRFGGVILTTSTALALFPPCTASRIFVRMYVPPSQYTSKSTTRLAACQGLNGDDGHEDGPRESVLQRR